MDDATTTRRAVTFDDCAHVEGPFYHGTKPSSRSARAGRRATVELPGGPRLEQHLLHGARGDGRLGSPARERAGRGPGRGRIYVVEPRGPFEDDPNVTDKRFPGNPTQSYRTRHPLRVVAELEEWEGHPPEVLAGMLDSLAQLREQGLDVIED